MPNYDRTGPNGEGPLTGGQRGNCRSLNFRNFINCRNRGLGFQRKGRQGFNFGFNRRVYKGDFLESQNYENDLEFEKKLIKQDIDNLKLEMNYLENQLKKFEKE